MNKLTPEETALVESNMKLVYHVLHRYFKRAYANDDYEDYVQSGMVGLVKAAKAYDAKRGKFSTFATTYIYGYMMHHWREYEYNFFGITWTSEAKELNGKKRKLEMAGKTEAEIFEVVGEKGMRADPPTVQSIDYVAGNEKSDRHEPFSNTLPDKVNVAEKACNKLYAEELIEEVKPRLSKREMDIALTHLMLGERQRETGDRFHVSHTYVGQCVRSLKREMKKVAVKWGEVGQTDAV